MALPPLPANGAAPAEEMPPVAAGPSVVATIMDNGDGTYTVYPGDEPEEGMAPDMSTDDVAAMGAEGDMPAPEGQPADSPEAAVKIVYDLLKGAAPDNADDQFAAGFGGAPEMAQKY